MVPKLPVQREGRGKKLLFVLLLAVLAILGLVSQSPRIGMFLFPGASSLGQTKTFLQAIASQSRAVGSVGHDKARDYLLAELRTMGVHTEVQLVVTPSANGRSSFRVENILARIPGHATTGAILFLAHYDSVTVGPGAGDNAAAVAVMLETIRVVIREKPYRNDLVFLFSDGEELGLLGSQAFVEQHPWMGNIRIAFNFDSGGVSGPLALWETSRGNRWLVREYAQAVPFAVAHSWTAHMSYGTDFSHFRKTGIAGLSFGFLGNQFTHYHRATDTFENLDENTLLHTRQSMLGLVKHFGNLDLSTRRDSDTIFFTVFGIMFSYSESVAWLLVIGVVGLFVFLLAARRDREPLSMRRILGASATLFATMLATSLLVHAIWQGIRLLHPLYYTNYPDESYNAWIYRIAFALLSLATTLAAFSWIRRKQGDDSLIAGCCLTWVAFSIAITSVRFEASYLVTLPAISLGLSALARYRLLSENLRLAVSAGLAVPTLLVFVPLINTVFTAAGLRASFVVAALVVVLVSGLVIQFLDVIELGSRSVVATIALLVIVLLGIGSATSHFDNEHPDSGREVSDFHD